MQAQMCGIKVLFYLIDKATQRSLTPLLGITLQRSEQCLDSPEISAECCQSLLKPDLLEKRGYKILGASTLDKGSLRKG